jgi:hypothetical protein
MNRRVLVFVFLACVAIAGFWTGFRDAGAIPLPAERVLNPPPLGEVRRVDVNVSPSVPEYSVAPDLSNVAGIQSLPELSDYHRGLLAENGFCVLPSPSLDIYTTYGANPSPFITSDSVLHAYMVLLTDTLKSLEEAYLADELERFVPGAHQRAEQLAGESPETLKPAGEKALAFYAVVHRLLDPEAEVRDTVKREVEAEVSRILEARFVGELPGDERPRDYTVYEPTAGYAENETLEKYYRARKYLSMNTHPFESAEDVQACLLVSLAALGDGEARLAYTNLFRLDRFLVGEGEDPTPFDVLAKAHDVFGDSILLEELGESDAALQLREKLKAFPKPKIADQPQQEPGADPMLGWGMRIFSPGVTIRAAAFQQIGRNQKVPGGRHMAHVLGNNAVDVSDEEKEWLSPATELMDAARSADPASLSIHTTTLTVLSELSREWPEGYPQFMRAPAWRLKTANTQLAGWAELEHATYLYAKDNAMYLGEALRRDEFHGYVEPVPDFYAALWSLAHRTRTAFEELGVFGRIGRLKRPAPRDGDSGGDIVATVEHYKTLEGVLSRLVAMSEKELENRPFDEDEIAFLRDFGETLKYLCFNESNTSSAPEPMGVVVRIVREYLMKQGIHVGTGRPFCIYVIVPWMGELHWAEGAVYSYYELTRPLTEPLTDAAWKKELTGAYQVHTEKPWLFGKRVGVDPVEWSEEEFRAWLPEEVSDDDFGNSYSGSHASQFVSRSWIRPFLDRVAFVSLSADALAAAEEEFARGRHEGERTRLVLYLWLRDAAPEVRKGCGIRALETMKPHLREKPSIAHSNDYRCWLYYSLMLLGDQAEDPEVIAAVADLIPCLTDETAMKQLLEDETTRKVIEAAEGKSDRKADAGGG